jgi:uncharacterized protein
MMYFDPLYFLMIAPAVVLALWAQYRVRSTYARAMQVDAHLTGASAARYLLDQDGLHDVEIEETEGTLSDHYDPSKRVLRLSHDVYHSRSAAAVGIAAHEAGHALQHAHGYAPLAIRNLAVPAAQFGSGASLLILMIGVFMQSFGLVLAGVIGYAGLVFFQLVNLPVEFDASNRAKRLLTEYQIVTGEGAAEVRSVLNAAAWTYVAATLQSVLTLAYFALRFLGPMNSRDE